MPILTHPHRQLKTVSQFCKENSAFSVGGMRWLLFHRHKNGLEKAVVRVGTRRILIDTEKFFEWLDAQNGHGEGGGVTCESKRERPPVTERRLK